MAFLRLPLQSLGFAASEVDDGSVFLFREVGAGHLAFTEVSDGGVVLEVTRLSEAEVVWVDVVIVMHHHPAVFTDTFPTVGSFMGCVYSIVVVIVHLIGACDGS